MASMLNKAEVRRRIFERVAAGKPAWAPRMRRVSESVYVRLEERLLRIIDGMVEDHPSSGVTFDP